MLNDPQDIFATDEWMEAHPETYAPRHEDREASLAQAVAKGERAAPARERRRKAMIERAKARVQWAKANPVLAKAKADRKEKQNKRP